MLLGDFSLNSNANAMLIACSGGWQLTYSGCSYMNIFPRSRDNLDVLPPPLATCSWHYHTVHCPLSCAEAALCGDMKWSNIKKNHQTRQLLCKRSFPDPIYSIAPQPVASTQADRRLTEEKGCEQETWVRQESGNFSKSYFLPEEWLLNCIFRLWLLSTRPIHPGMYMQ